MSYPKIILKAPDNIATMSNIVINISTNNLFINVQIIIPLNKKINSIICQSSTVFVKFVEIVQPDTFKITFGDNFTGDDEDHLFFYSYTLINM